MTGHPFKGESNDITTKCYWDEAQPGDGHPLLGGMSFDAVTDSSVSRSGCWRSRAPALHRLHKKQAGLDTRSSRG